MEVLTSEQMVRQVARRWRQTYKNQDGSWRPIRLPKRPDKSAEEIYNELKGLSDNAAPEDVDNIIGNDSWTRFMCDECADTVSKVIEMGDDQHFCENCIRRAVSKVWP